MIEGNFVVPGVYMKTKYGPTSQYSYNIKDENAHDHHADHPADAYRSGYKPVEPKKPVQHTLVWIFEGI